MMHTRCSRAGVLLQALWLVPQDAGRVSFIWHKGPVDRSPRLTLLYCFFYPSGYLDAGQEGEKTQPPCMVTNTVSVGTEVYGGGRGKQGRFGSTRPNTARGNSALTHPPVPGCASLLQLPLHVSYRA